VRRSFKINLIEEYQEAAAAGDAVAQYKLAIKYIQGAEVPKNMEKALAWLRKSASQGYALAQFQIGRIYMKGKGVKKNVNTAKLWLEKAAHQGDSDAQVLLGVIYNIELGEPDKAAVWFERSAKQDNPAGVYNLAMCRFKGMGVEIDDAEGLRLLIRSAELGLDDAQAGLGAIYYHGENGVQRNVEKAFRWYFKAAEQGHKGAQQSLARMFYNGKVVERDFLQSYMWYSLAYSGGNTYAADWLEIIAQHLTPDELQKARNMATNWRKYLSVPKLKASSE